MIKIVDDSNFTSETSEGLVLVDVFTPPCGPCKQQAKILEEYQDLVKILKVNAHESSELSARLKVRSVPTLIWYMDGIEVKRTVGVQSGDEIVSSFAALTSGINAGDRT